MAEVLCEIVPILPPELRSDVRTALGRLDDTPNFRASVEYMLLACERPVPRALTNALPEAVVGELDGNQLVILFTSVAAELSDDVIQSVVEALVERGRKGENPFDDSISHAIGLLARTGRLNLDQALKATGGKLCNEDLAELLLHLQPFERDELADLTLKSLSSVTTPCSRIAILITLQAALTNSPFADSARAQLSTELAHLNLGTRPTPIVPTWTSLGPQEFLSVEDQSGIVKALMERRNEFPPNNWAEWAATLAPLTPARSLPDLIPSISSANSARRTRALLPIVVEIARRGDADMMGTAWEQILAMSETDDRWHFLENIRVSLPLADRLWGNAVASIIADVVTQLTASFP